MPDGKRVWNPNPEEGDYKVVMVSTPEMNAAPNSKSLYHEKVIKAGFSTIGNSR